jgi:hypothetical protein
LVEPEQAARAQAVDGDGDPLYDESRMTAHAPKKRPGPAGAFKSATRALRALDYFAPAETAFSAWWCLLA